jgi:transcriptional regulator with XRE-family HTH domain
VTDWVLSQFGSERKIAEVGYRRFVRDRIGVGSIWNSVRAQSVLREDDFIESLSDYVKGRKQIPEIAKSQRFMNKPPLGDIFGPEVLGDRRKRDKSIGKAVLEHGYTQREVADHLGIHFTSVSRILRARDKILINRPDLASDPASTLINVPNLENEGGQTHLYFFINSTWTGLPKGLQYLLGTSSQIGSLHHFIIEKILGSISKYD